MASLTPSTRRVLVGLVLPGMERLVDVTVQPAAACRALGEAAAEASVNPAEATAIAREAITEAGWRSDSWLPGREMPLLAWFGGIGFPLLGAAYDSGASPIDEVPRWAKPILAAPTFGEGAAVAFANRASRPVKRALVEAVRPTPTGQISLGVLALALMGREILEPDCLARVLACDRAVHPVCDLPDPSTIAAAREVFSCWGATRSERILVEAAGRPDGLGVLMTTVGYARQLGDHGPAGRLPKRLFELHDVYRVLVPTAAEHPAHRAGAGGAGRELTPGHTGAEQAGAEQAGAEQAGGDRAGRDRAGRDRARHDQVGHSPQATRSQVRAAPHPVLAPQATAQTVTSPLTPIETSTAYRALDGASVADMSFVLPRTVGDLNRWGAVLQNCLGSFGSAVVAGQTVVVGVQRNGRLIYAVEITRAGSVRQFNGRANRAPRDRDRRAVIAALARTGVINPASSHNQRWMAGIKHH